MSELIGAMCLAYDSTYSLKGHVPAMAAAARVIADALLSALTADEKQRFGSNYERNCIAYGDVDALLKARRSLIEPKPKIPDDRILLKHHCEACSKWCVYVDGERKTPSFESKDAAEIYRLGFIEQLKKKEAE